MADFPSLYWKIIYGWTAVSLAIFAALGAWGLVGFTLSYGVIFGGTMAEAHPMARAVLRSAGRNGPVFFLALAAAWSCLEELWCNGFGCVLAIHSLWADLVFVGAVFTAWLASWRFVLARRYRFRSGEAIILGSLVGVFFELVLPGHFFTQPLGALLLAPLDILVYRGLFLLPMSIIDFSGARETPVKYVAALAVPIAAAGAVAVVVFIVFSLIGAPLI